MGKPTTEDLVKAAYAKGAQDQSKQAGGNSDDSFTGFLNDIGQNRTFYLEHIHQMPQRLGEEHAGTNILVADVLNTSIYNVIDDCLGVAEAKGYGSVIISYLLSGGHQKLDEEHDYESIKSNIEYRVRSGQSEFYKLITPKEKPSIEIRDSNGDISYTIESTIEGLSSIDLPDAAFV